jgi:type II secretory pathway predicted ATPase ExeA
MTMTSAQFDQSLFHISDLGESYLSPVNKKNLEKLINGIQETKKMFLVTGGDGVGKTTLIQRAVFELGTKARLLSVNRGSLSYEELIEYLGKDLETGFSTDASLQIKKLRIEELLQMWSIQHVVIHIDQSLDYQQKMLEDIFKLIDGNVCDSCFFHLIITGLPGLVKALKKYSLPDSVIAEACSIQVKPLVTDEVIAYVDFYLQGIKGRRKSLFSDEALKSIVHYSKGLPRLINRLCNLGLLTAKLDEKPTVTSEMIEEVLENSLLLGNECGFVASSLKEEEFLTKEFAIQDKEPLASNSVTSQELLEQEAKEEKQVEDYQLSDNEYSIAPTHPVRKSSRSPTRKVSGKNSAIFDFSNKTVFISAFIMGIIFSVLIGAGLYFLQQPNQEASVKQVALAGTSQFQVEQHLKQQKVAALLKHAEQQFAKLQLMKPEKNNAWETYQEVLGLIPNHPKASAGIAKIKQTYVSWARQEIQRKNYQQAGYYYRKVLEASPDDQNIMQALRDTHQKQNPKKELKAPVAKIALTDEEKQRIQALLIQAKRQLANKKLMTPVKDSAWATYKKILALDPDHQQAISGINKIKEIYISWARYEIKKGNKKHATFLFQKGLEISPDDREIISALANTQAIETTSIRDNNALSRGEYDKLLNDQKGIDELLSFAERQIASKRLTRPVHDSAFTIYKAILDRFPTHEKAIAGVKRIKEIYILWAKHEVNQGNYRHAEFLYGKALRVAPEDHGILIALSQTKTLGKIKKNKSAKSGVN